jgi:tetratricopeptide (TPR) repeat protein
LLKRGQILHSETFWEWEFDDPSNPSQDDVGARLHQLAEYVAVWVLFNRSSWSSSRKAARFLPSRFRGRFFRGPEPITNRAAFGTSDWKSYAYFRAGHFAAEQGREQATKNMYVKALKADPNFTDPRVNLGRWLLLQDEYIRAKRQLKRAIDVHRCLCIEGIDVHRRPAYYSAIYNLALVRYTEAKQGSQIDEERRKAILGEARKLIEGLITDIEETLELIRGLDDPDPPGAAQPQPDKQDAEPAANRSEPAPGARCPERYRDPNLAQYLEGIKPVIEAALACVLIELGEEEEGLKRTLAIADLASVMPRVQFNLACCYSVLAAHLQSLEGAETEAAGQAEDLEVLMPTREEAVESCLDHLEQCFDLDPAFASYLDDPSLAYVEEHAAKTLVALTRKYVQTKRRGWVSSSG